MESILKNRLLNLNNQLDRKTVIRVEASLSSGYSILFKSWFQEVWRGRKIRGGVELLHRNIEKNLWKYPSINHFLGKAITYESILRYLYIRFKFVKIIIIGGRVCHNFGVQFHTNNCTQFTITNYLSKFFTLCFYPWRIIEFNFLKRKNN